MKKRIVSTLLALCMLLCLMPTAAFAEESTETPPECSCETACTAESMNAECPVCGAEGALPENCAKCARPADDAAVQPEGEVSDPQPETALTTLIGGNDTLKEVNSESELTNAIADSTVGTVKLAANIDIGSSLTVNRAVTLDLNGKVLQMTGSGSVIKVESSGNLTLTDSNTAAEHKFMPGTNGLWVLNEASGTEIVTGGVITGGTGYPFQLYSTVNCGGGVYIAPDGQLTMTGGNIIGCSAEYGGGVCIYPKQDNKQGQFSMSGGSIIGCSAESGGGVCAFGKFQMSAQAVIRSCTAEGTSFNCGGGVWVDGSFEMSGEAIIEGCQAISESAYGGGVYVNSSSSFVMSEKAEIENCQAISTPSSPSKGGGVHLANNTEFTLSGSAVIQNCKAVNSDGSGETYGGGVSADNVKKITLADSASIAICTAANGSGLYITGSSWDPNVYGQLYANGGLVDGDVVLGNKDRNDEPCTITGLGGTVFNGKVTVTPGSTIESGTFNGEVINNGTITGGVFNNTVSGSGTIKGGTLNTPMTGSGTKNDPYQIGTAEQLKRFRDIVNGAGGQTQNRGACAVLTNDIVLNDGTFDANGNYTTTGLIGTNPEEWTPIGKYTNSNDNAPYTGTFDGQGHSIKGLYVNSASDDYVGLFGCLEGAAVRNLTVDGYVQGCYVVSGIAGDASANSTIENCRNNCRAVSEFVTGRSSLYLYVGGIVGLAKDTTIVGCINTGAVEARGSNDMSRASKAAGIVGILNGNVIVKNCYNTGEINVTGDKMTEGTAGGIAGSRTLGGNTVSDCYNLGAVTVSYTGNYDEYIAKVGGIMGYSFFSGTTVSNCYSVGTLTSTTGTGTSYIGGVVGITDGTVENCYYLDSTATKAVGNDDGTVDEATGPKTAAQLGDGTVLALLINNRGDSEHPWNSKCQYLAAAGKTLPVFKTQTGDAHTHDQSSPWKSNETEHWQVCACGAVFNKANHSGGTATCTQRATCAVCGAEYGDVLGHDFTTNWTHDDNEHWKQCSRCDKKDDVGPHTWDNGTITTAPTCTKAGERTYTCTECGATKTEPIDATGHSWKSDWTSDATHHWHECANDNCDVTDNSGKDGYAEHSGGTATCTEKAVCTHCGQSYGETAPANHTGKEQWTQTATTHEKKWNCCNTVSVPNENHEWTDGVCSECGYVCQHEDVDKNHICDICGKTISEHKDADNNHICDYCNKKISDHSGGTATCIAKAVCEICKESYGSLDPNNHADLKHIDAKAATAAEEGNIEYWYCDGCKKYFSDAAAKTEITKAATVTAKLPPKITAGDGATVTQGEKKELSFTSDASFADFLRVELDGTTLDEKNYTKREGSTIITLNRDFVATLSVGEHTLAIVSQHGTATAKFTVKAKPAETATPQPTVTPQPTAQPTQTAQPQPTVQPVSPIPSTGDTANPALWFALLIVSGSALAAIFVLRRKANRK